MKEKNCLSNMHLMFSYEKKLYENEHFPPILIKYQRVIVCDMSITTSECKLLIQKQKDSKKKMEKILVYQVLYINHTGNVDLLGLIFTLRIYLYELYFFRLNKESCTICDTYVHVYISSRYM